MSMDTDERIALLEQKLAGHEKLIARLIAYGRLTPRGRQLLKILGIS
jgi:hypothetical protein